MNNLTLLKIYILLCISVHIIIFISYYFKIKTIIEDEDEFFNQRKENME